MRTLRRQRADLAAAQAHEAELASALDDANEQIAELLGQQDGGTPPPVVLIEAEAFARSPAPSRWSTTSARATGGPSRRLSASRTAGAEPRRTRSPSRWRRARTTCGRASAPPTPRTTRCTSGWMETWRASTPAATARTSGCRRPASRCTPAITSSASRTVRSGVRIDAVAVAVAGTPVADLDAELEMMAEPPPDPPPVEPPPPTEPPPTGGGSPWDLQADPNFDAANLPAAARPYQQAARAALSARRGDLDAAGIRSEQLPAGSSPPAAGDGLGGRTWAPRGTPACCPIWWRSRTACRRTWDTDAKGRYIDQRVGLQRAKRRLQLGPGRLTCGLLTVAMVGYALKANGSDAAAAEQVLPRSLGLLERPEQATNQTGPSTTRSCRTSLGCCWRTI